MTVQTGEGWTLSMTTAGPVHTRAQDNLDFSGRTLDGANFADRLVQHACFDRASMRKVNLTRAEFRDCTFIGTCLDGAIMERTVFENCDFANATMTNANVQEAVFRATAVLGYNNKKSSFRQAKNNFSGAVLDGSNFNRARLVAATIHNVRASNVDFSNCDLRNSSFDGTSFNDVNFSGAKLQDANFAKCPDARNHLPAYAQMIATFVQPISAAKLDAVLKSHQRWLDTEGVEGERLNLQGFDLSGQKLDGYDFSGTDFRGARLDKASLKKVKLVAADMRDASMLGTNFSGSDLRGAMLSPNALRKAVLSHTLIDESAQPKAIDVAVMDRAFQPPSPQQ
jgi:uncharacterized protein YjbI with pentapeptide repeats